MAYGNIKLTPKAWVVFRSKEKVMGRLEETSAGLKQREEGLHYDLAPTQEILDCYKKNKGDWPAYERAFLSLLAAKKEEENLSR